MPKVQAPPAVNPVLTGPTGKISEKDNTVHVMYTAMTASQEWSLATGVHQPAADLLQTTEDLVTNRKELDDLLQKVAAKRLAELLLLQLWSTRLQLCQGAVKSYCSGSAAKCQALAWGPGGRTVRPPATVPTDLKAVRSEVSGTATFTWKGDGYEHDYQVQYCTDIANQATYSQARTVSKRRFQLPGQTPGAILHLRVLTLDAKLPTGQTEWSPWLAVTVSA